LFGTVASSPVSSIAIAALPATPVLSVRGPRAPPLA
jgi:hypothetical protein